MTTNIVQSFIRRLGNPGNYQAFVFLLLACNFFPIAFNNSVMTFYAAEPDFNCKMPQGWAWHSNASIPLVVINGATKFDNCHMYKDPENHALGNKQCIYGWDYHLTPPEWNVVTEWNLVCNHRHSVTVAKLLYLGGSLVGALIFGPLAEKFGRRNLMMFCLLTQMAIGVGIFFVRQFFVFVVLRAVQGILIQGLECVSFVLVLELFQPGFRTLAGSTCFFIYSGGMMFLSLLAYSIKHWRYIQLAISLPSAITVVYIWLVPESLRYLITSQKADEIIAVLKKFARFTAIKLSDNEREEVKTACKQLNVDDNLTYDVRDLLRSTILRRHTLFHCFCWLSAFLMYCSLTLFIPNLNSNKYINFFLVGLIELLSHVIAFVAFYKFGRRRPLFIMFIASGILSIASVLVDHLAKNRSDGTAKFSITLAVVGKICITGCLSGLYIFSAETFPTVARTIGIGLCAAAKICGGLTAPLVQLLGVRTLKAIPVILVGAVALVAAFVVLMLPETFKEELPDFVADSEDLGKRKIISPMVDKMSHNVGKMASTPNHPLTPPIKRASSTSSDVRRKDDDEIEKIDRNVDSLEKTDVVQENNFEVAENEEDPKPSSHNRNVRFLGIDVMSADPKPAKKTSIGIDERRVRFSNVVHDIQDVTTAILNVTATDADVVKEENTTNVTSVEITPIPIAAVKPAFSILKKTSNDETEKKIVKSPHPARKISPSTVDDERINSADEVSEIVLHVDNIPITNKSDQIELSADEQISDDVPISIANDRVITRHRKDSVYDLGIPSTSYSV